MIEVRNVTKALRRVQAVDGISFSVAAGEIVGVLGPNGAGKTTTLRMLAGIFPPTTGTVRIAGHDPIADPRAARRAVGYFAEHAPYYPELPVEGYLRFVARLKRVPRAARADAVARVLAACDLEAVARRRVGTLSKGYRQRVGLAQALCGDPPILMLDEPTIGLDPGQVDEIRALIGGLRGERTVLFSSHILSEVEKLCSRVIVIARGQVVGEGAPTELAARVGARRRVWLRAEGSVDEIGSALRGIAGVVQVEADTAGFRIEGDRDDLARAVGQVAAAGGWAIVELRQETLDLEEIFRRLVRPS